MRNQRIATIIMALALLGLALPGSALAYPRPDPAPGAKEATVMCGHYKTTIEFGIGPSGRGTGITVYQIIEFIRCKHHWKHSGVQYRHRHHHCHHARRHHAR